MTNRLTTEKREDGWWVVDPNNIDCGPYSTKAEADEDRRGLKAFYQHQNNEDEFITGDLHGTV